MKIVELFSGIGSQAKAFEKLQIEHEVVNTCEWDIHAIIAYDLIHNGAGIHPDAQNCSKRELVDILRKYTLSNDGKNPMMDITLRTLNIETLRTIYSAILKTHNYVSITDLKGTELPDNIDFLTYSFPCQDLSNVGALHGYNKGIDRDANNHSGLLWEVERILKERAKAERDMPHFLLLENVSALLSKRHKKNFEEWQGVLNELGYYNHIYCLNALDFGLPQNRYRLLMLSVRIDDKVTEEVVNSYFEAHNLENEIYRNTLNIPHPILANYLRTDYNNPVFRAEAEECQPNDTESRRRIWEDNLQITDLNGNIIVDKVATLTTKQDRHPNSGNLRVDFNNGKGSYRYLTPRECMMLMGFDEADYEVLVNNEIILKKDKLLLTRDKIIRLAGNSIAVNVLMAIFRQAIEIEDVLSLLGGEVEMDVHDKDTRSYNMSRIKGKGTKPEDLVCKYLFSKGFRYRRNVKALPGTPDIVLKKYKTVVFINGCFWHKHIGCKYFVWPKTNAEFWKDKIEANAERDQRNYKSLNKMGWKIIILWECELKKGKAGATLEQLIADLRINSEEAQDNE